MLPTIQPVYQTTSQRVGHLQELIHKKYLVTVLLRLECRFTFIYQNFTKRKENEYSESAGVAPLRSVVSMYGYELSAAPAGWRWLSAVLPVRMLAGQELVTRLFKQRPEGGPGLFKRQIDMKLIEIIINCKNY